MSLKDEVKKLRELEQKYKITPYDGNLEVYSLHLREHGSAMLEVLGCFREGDCAALNRLYEGLSDCALSEDMQKDVEILRRLYMMAALMEKEEQ